MNVFEEWPERWYGFYTRQNGTTDDGFPQFDDLVDLGWRPSDKDRLINYLKTADVAAVSGFANIICPLCGIAEWNPSLSRSDGIWLWPRRLEHDVAAHQVRLPDQFVNHIRNAQYAPRSIKGIPPQNLPWPRIRMADK